MQEKRQYVRWQASLPVKYKIDNQGKELSCITGDISNGGIRINCSDRLNLDSLLDMTIEMSGDIEPLRANGKVVWQNKSSEAEKENFSTGIKFIGLGYSDIDRMYNYLYKYHRQELVSRWWAST